MVALGLCGVLIAAVAGTARAESPATTRPAPGTWRIALLADPHVSSNRRYSNYVDNFQRVIREVNDAHVDAVFIAGDLTQSFDTASADKFLELMKGFRPHVWYVPGNHDVGNKPVNEKPATVSDDRVSRFEKVIGPGYFAADVAPGVRVIGITSSLFDTKLSREAEQWTFLESQLSQPRDGITLLLTHYPVFVKAVDEPDDYFNIDRAVRPRLLELLRRGGVTAILSGHLHRPIDLTCDGIRMIGAPAISFGLPEGKQPVGWTLVTIDRDRHVTAELKYLDPQPSTRPSLPRGSELLKKPQ